MNKFKIQDFNLGNLFIGILLFLLFIVGVPAAVMGVDVKLSKNKEDSRAFNLSPEKAERSVINNNTNEIKVKVYISNEDKIIEVPLEEYVRGVVWSEMPAEFNIEALKAQAVAARTYTLNHIEKLGGYKCKEAKGADICDTVHCQVYMSKDRRINGWSKSKGSEYFNKISKAVTETEGQVLTYEGKIITSPLYFAISSGKTEDVKDVFGSSRPYLVSVSSSGEEVAPKYKTNLTIKRNDFVSKINSKYPGAKLDYAGLEQGVKVINKTKGGSVKTLKVGKVQIKGTDFRKLFKLNSTNFTFKFSKDKVEIMCIGYGHGIGMSQWGANIMGQKGKDYKEILKHYYNGVKIENIKK